MAVPDMSVWSLLPSEYRSLIVYLMGIAFAMGGALGALLEAGTAPDAKAFAAIGIECERTEPTNAEGREGFRCIVR